VVSVLNYLRSIPSDFVPYDRWRKPFLSSAPVLPESDANAGSCPKLLVDSSRDLRRHWQSNLSGHDKRGCDNHLHGYTGPVIVDLKGFTLTGGAGDSIGVGIGIFAGTNGPNSYPITVRNGSLVNFGFGVWAEARSFSLMSDITVNNLVIHLGATGQSGNGAGVLFASAVSSTVSNYTFSGGTFGVEDTASPGGNNYSNDTFVGVNPLFVTAQNGGIPQVINHCQFGAPHTCKG
jgi:hypothetical protein